MQNKFDQLALIIANFTKIYAQFAQQKNLSYNELHFFYYLAQHKQATPKDISQTWSIPKQTINSICTKFSKLGYLNIKTDDQDKRKKILSLTSTGKDFIQPVVNQISKAEISVQEKFSIKQFDKFLNDFEKLTTELNHLL